MSKHFVSAKDKYKDNLEAAISLLVVGTLGIFGLVLINLDIIDVNMAVRSKVFVSIFLGLVFVAFIVYGIISVFISKKHKSNIETESSMREEYDKYIKENFTKESIDYNIAFDDDTTSEETYIYRTDLMLRKLMAAFPDIDTVLADELIEANYDDIFNN